LKAVRSAGASDGHRVHGDEAPGSRTATRPRSSARSTTRSGLVRCRGIISTVRSAACSSRARS